MSSSSKTNNSLTQFLSQVLRIEKNSLEIIAKLAQVTSSDSSSIQISLSNDDGTTTTYSVPGIGYIESEIERIDKNFTSLIGQDGNDVIARMSDGSYKKIIQTSLFSEPNSIDSLLVPSTFKKKNNWFFESFLSPLLYVSFDITNYVDYDTEDVSYKRIILNADTDAKKSYFDTNLKGKNDIDYSDLMKNLSSQNISYFVDEDIVRLPVSISRYSGTFDVISYKDETIKNTQSDGTIITSKVRKYKLNTLKYTDNLQSYKNTLTLKVGDSLQVGTTTQYEITLIDSSTNSVVVKKTSGMETPKIGTDMFSISTKAFSTKEAQINIGFDEREIIFMKAVDKTTNMTTATFSPGVAFYTNELIITYNGTDYTLYDFYMNEVMDFGSCFLYLSKEGMIPSVYGLIPDPPTLSSDNFDVVLLNSQKFDTDTIEDLESKISQKNSLETEITQLETSITKKKNELNTTIFSTDTEKKAVQNQLDSLISQKTSKSSLYASVVKDLSTYAKNLPSELSNPKYRVRGFFPIPQAKTSNKTRNQHVIGFRIQYRYLSKDGTAPGTKEMSFVDNNGETVIGYFSNWIQYDSEIRKKSYDSTLGIYLWENESVQDADEVNVNQLDIPITSGEQVEIRIKSISEAGWPMNPLMSEWSDSITIAFPDDLSNNEELLESLKSSLYEETRVNFEEELSSMGLDLHLESSYTQNDKYFAHSTDDIASGFYNDAGVILTLYEKLKEMETTITNLKAEIEKETGTLGVYILDSDGNKYSVTNNSTVDIFAGYYYDIVNALASSKQKGAIVTKTYNLILENSASSTLQLASTFPGGLDVGLSDSDASTNLDYGTSRKYDMVPISLNSMIAASTDNSESYHAVPFQSSQQLSQYIYCRYTNIGLLNPMYGANDGSNYIESNSLYPSIDGTITKDFIWNVDSYDVSGNPEGNGVMTDFSIHILHPDINTGDMKTLQELNEPDGAGSVSPAVYPKFVHSSFFNLQSSEDKGKYQTKFLHTNVSAGGKEAYPIKLGFSENDRYLIGKNTCGSYLFISPYTYSDILVDGTDYRAVKEIKNGDANRISIPIIFQFRMTDFYGSGNNGTGNIGGFTTKMTNLTYTKKIGFDVNVKNSTTFSFDVQVTAKYKKDSSSQVSSTVSSSTISSSQSSNLSIF